MFFQHLLDVVNHGVELVLGFNGLALLLVFGRVCVGFLRHPLDLFLAQTRRGRDRDLLVLARGVVFRGHVQNAVRVNVERHFNLRNPPRCRRQSRQMEFPQRPVLRRHRTFALQHMHFHRRLTVRRRRKRLRLLRRNRRVPRNHRCRHAAQCFNRQRQRSHIQQQQVLHFALEHSTLNRRAYRHDFIRIHALVSFASKQFFYNRLDARHSRLPAHQHHFVDLRSVHAGVFHALFRRSHRALQNVFDHRFQLRPRQLLHQVLRTRSVRRNKWQIDLRLHRG